MAQMKATDVYDKAAITRHFISSRAICVRLTSKRLATNLVWRSQDEDARTMTLKSVWPRPKQQGSPAASRGRSRASARHRGASTKFATLKLPASKSPFPAAR